MEIKVKSRNIWISERRISWCVLAFWIQLLGFPGGTSGKESIYQCQRLGFHPWLRKIPWRKAWQPTPVFLPGEFPWTEEPGGPEFMGLQSDHWLDYHPWNIQLSPLSENIQLLFVSGHHQSYPSVALPVRMIWVTLAIGKLVFASKGWISSWLLHHVTLMFYLKPEFV